MNRDYAEVYGEEPVKFIQDGLRFLGNGSLAPDPDVEQPEAPRSDFIDKLLAPVTGDPEPPVVRQRAIGPDDMRLAENRALKKRWDDYGMGDWKGVAHARKALGIE